MVADIREKIPKAESIFIKARLLKFTLELHPEHITVSRRCRNTTVICIGAFILYFFMYRNLGGTAEITFVPLLGWRFFIFIYYDKRNYIVFSKS